MINFTQNECAGSNQYWNYTITYQSISIDGEATTGNVNRDISEIAWSNTIIYTKGISKTVPVVKKGKSIVNKIFMI